MNYSRDDVERMLREAADVSQAALRESQAREAALVLALRATDIAVIPYTDRGNEVSRMVQAALASPSDAAAALLRKASLADPDLDARWQTVVRKWTEAQADRDRWLGHVRALVRWASGHAAVFRPEVDAARRDLEQHDAGRAK